MTARDGEPHPETLRDLIARLIDDAKAYLHAEIALVKGTVLAKVNAAKTGVIFAVLALFIAQAALTILVAALGLALARWLGSAGGMAVGAVIGFVVAGMCGWLAARGLSGKSGS